MPNTPQHSVQVSRALSRAYDNVELKAGAVDVGKNAKEEMETLKVAIKELSLPPVNLEEAAAAEAEAAGGS